MTVILRGKEISEKIKKDLSNRILDLKKTNKTPKLATIRLGENPDDISYERNIIRNTEKLGIEHLGIILDENSATEELRKEVEKLNEDDSVHGILILSLLTTRDDQDIIRKVISPEKDIDGIHPLNLEKIFRGEIDGFGPCAAIAAIKVLEHENINLKGKNFVIVNRSMVIGKPLAMMALAHDATVTICHSNTKNLKELTKAADIVCVAIGRAKFFDKEYFNEDAIVIDIGIAMDENNKLCGDVDFEDVKDYVKMITPVPGGLGGVTTSLLLEHVVRSAENN